MFRSESSDGLLRSGGPLPPWRGLRPADPLFFSRYEGAIFVVFSDEARHAHSDRIGVGTGTPPFSSGNCLLLSRPPFPSFFSLMREVSGWTLSFSIRLAFFCNRGRFCFPAIFKVRFADNYPGISFFFSFLCGERFFFSRGWLFR